MSQDLSSEHGLIGMYRHGDTIFIRAITPLHVGVGRAGGIVDLPVQKDLYGYPEIYGSSLKGSLRGLCLRRYRSQRNTCKDLFGSEENPGNVVVLDAKLLLIPARILRGIYGYITSPLLLKQFADYLSLVNAEKGKELADLVEKLVSRSEKWEVITSNTASSRYSINVNNKKKVVINEEFWLKLSIDDDIIKKVIDTLPQDLRRGLGLDPKSLLIVSDSDDISLQIVEKSLIRLQRIRLEEERKIVAHGQLWSEEYVPRNTLLYTIALYANGSAMSDFRRLIATKYLIVGGHETIGKGVVELYRA